MLSRSTSSSPQTLQSDDFDPDETREWLEALESVLDVSGSDRALFLLSRLEDCVKSHGIKPNVLPYSAYRNTIPLETEGVYPGDLEIEARISSINRWNALVMVVRANKAYGELGGHIASYASVAEIFEVGFNHFFRAGTPTHAGDLVFYQPHSAPGVYARAFLEGRLSESDLSFYRREAGGVGLSGVFSATGKWMSLSRSRV